MTKDPAQRNAVGYVRVSTESQLDGFGLDVQRAAIESFAAAEHLNLIAIHADEGISGSEDVAGRRGLAAALDDLTAGNATVLIIPKLDRLARDLMVQEQVLADAWRAGADVLSCSETERTYCRPDDPTDPSRQLIRQVLGAVAAYERAMIRARLVAGRRRRIQRDGYAGGPQPFGWADQRERDILDLVTELRVQHYSWADIAEHLNNTGRFKRNGTPWTTADIHRTYQRAAQRESHAARIDTLATLPI